MEERYRLIKRGGTYYAHDKQTALRTSLHTADRKEALRLIHGKNESAAQPQLNAAIAKVYLAAQDPQLVERTWETVAKLYAAHGVASTQDRVRRAFGTLAFRKLFPLKLVDTTSSHLDAILSHGNPSTCNYLRRLHNLAVRKGWLLHSIVAPADWPKHRPTPRRAVTAEDHARIIAGESPVCDLKHHYGERPDLPRSMRNAFYDYPEYPDMDVILAEHSPLAQVLEMPRIPYLFVHGANDVRVHREPHSDAMVSELKAGDHEVIYIPLDDLEHGAPLPPDVGNQWDAFLLSFVVEQGP